MILGAFYYGYIATQLPAGFLSDKIGPKWLFGGGVLNTAVFNLLTPLIASWSATAFIVVKVIEGLGEVLVIYNKLASIIIYSRVLIIHIVFIVDIYVLKI